MIDGGLLLADLQRDESYRGQCYTDTTGNMTIGFGRNLRAHPLSRTEATMLLQNDIARVLTELHATFLWFDGLPEPKARALANLCFNVGLGGLLGFRQMLAACATGDWPTASKELLDSDYAKEVGARADRLAALLTS